jgi:hypothetical protein
MGKIGFVMKTILVLSFVFAGSVFAATCAADAYRKSCASCQFDNKTGKMDTECYKGYQSGGTSCVATSYPIAAGLYAQGKCPGIDACASEMTSCKSQYASGNDKADCAEGSVGVCFAAADECVKKAVIKCENPQGGCPAPSGLIMLVIGAVFLMGYARKG